MQGDEIGSFDDIQEIEWVKWDEGVVKVGFSSSEFLKGLNSYNKTSFTFAVEQGGDEKLMGITSKRLMLKLKAHHPLEGKVFEIKRIGVDMETDYEVQEVTE